jgi:hypothetical protein
VVAGSGNGRAPRCRRGGLRDYSRGWDHSIGEIFAEDYAHIHLQTPYQIRWLGAPSEEAAAALLADLGAATAPERITPPTAPLVVVRRGTLAAGDQRTLPFGLLGPGRRVTFTARVNGTGEPGTRARLEVVCGSRTFVARLGRGRDTTTIDARDLGPADCTATLVSTSATSHDYVVRLRLAVPT